MSKNKDKNDAEAKPKSGKLKIVLGSIALLVAGAGATFGAFASGMLGTHGEADAGPDVPTLVAKNGEDPYSAASEGKDAVEVVRGEGGSEYRTVYYTFEESFTSNLKDSPGLVQVSLSASTHYDGRVIQWLQLHEQAIRSAILVELADTPEDDVYSVEGKERLQKRLTASVNRVLEEEEGFGGVDAVHFQTFLVQ